MFYLQPSSSGASASLKQVFCDICFLMIPVEVCINASGGGAYMPFGHWHTTLHSCTPIH